MPGGDADLKRTASAELRERAEHSSRADATVRVGAADRSTERCQADPYRKWNQQTLRLLRQTERLVLYVFLFHKQL